MRPLLLVLSLLLISSSAQATAGDARASFALGKARLEQGDEVGAREAFLLSTKAAPTWLLPWLELGELAVRRREGIGEARQALAALEASGARNPRYHRILGDLAELAGEDEAAVAAWGASLARLPEQDDVRLRMASALERLERHEEAAQAYARLLARNPADLIVRARHAHALEAAGAYEAAREELETLVKLQPGKEIPLRRLARFLERRGEVERARRIHAEADRVGQRPPPRKMRPLPPSIR